MYQLRALQQTRQHMTNEINLNDLSTEQLEDLARRAAYRAFIAKILNDANSIISELSLTGENKDDLSDELTTRIDEETENAMTYYKDAYLTVFACGSDEQDELFEVTGEKSVEGECCNDVITKLAYWSYRRALSDCIESQLTNQ